MIQRIQSLYLLGAMAIQVYWITSMLSCDIPAELTTTLLALKIPILFITVFILFKFKNRILQIKLNKILLLLTITDSVILIFYDRILMWAINNNPDYIPGRWDIEFHFGNLILPILQTLFIFLALRAIKKDEEKVRSVDRLR